MRGGVTALFLHLADADPLPLLSAWKGAILFGGRRQRWSIDGVDVDEAYCPGRAEPILIGVSFRLLLLAGLEAVHHLLALVRHQRTAPKVVALKVADGLVDEGDGSGIDHGPPRLD